MDLKWTDADLGITPAAAPAPAAPPVFNAASYLAANPDVAAAVNAGQMTAEQHFEMFGRNEGRAR